MASTTGIELGRESCVLAGVRGSRAGVTEVMALHSIEPGAWPTLDVALIEMLRSVRRAKRFPRNARIVAWGLPDDPAGDDATARWLQRPLVAAGFRVGSILTPPQALALLAASRPRPTGDGAVVWLALNMQAAAIAIVHEGELLFARTFEWSYSTRMTSGKAQLLQRYSLVAQLAPEVRRGIAAVLASRGLAVEQAVTCGDLPELRSLTMPLIEELDLEVETLDSTEGLRAVGKARADRFAESAPAIRLACAAALVPSKRRGSVIRSAARIAAAVALLVALGWGGYTAWRAWAARSATPRQVTAQRTERPTAARPAAGAPTAPAARGPVNTPANPRVMAPGPGTKPGAGVPPVAPGKPLPPALANPTVGQPPAAGGGSKVAQPPARQAAPDPPGGPSRVAGPPKVMAQGPGTKPGEGVPVVSGKPSPPVPANPTVGRPAAAGGGSKVAQPPSAPAPPAGPSRVAGTPAGTAIATAPKPIVTPPSKPGIGTGAPIAPASSPGVLRPPPKPAATPPASAAMPPRQIGVEPGIKAPSQAPVERPAGAPRSAAPAVAPPLPGSATSPAAKAQGRTADRPAASAEGRMVEPPVTSAPRRPLEGPAPNATLRTLEPRAPSQRVRASALKDPLPKVDSVLIDQERRLAIIDGTIVAIGDSVGARVVVHIDREGVVLREPSGLSIRVSLRPSLTPQTPFKS